MSKSLKIQWNIQLSYYLKVHRAEASQSVDGASIRLDSYKHSCCLAAFKKVEDSVIQIIKHGITYVYTLQYTKCMMEAKDFCKPNVV